jgi:Questin oxidase-like
MNSLARAHYVQLTRQHRSRGPSWANGSNANHLPMALGALAALDASPAQMDAFTASYLPRLADPLTDDAQPFADMVEAQPFLSRISGVRRFEASFDAWIVRNGRAAVLEQWLPVLLGGAAAAAFHGLIRTAYGVQCENDEEVASGLAYWAATFAAVNAQGNATLPALRAADAIAALDAADALRAAPWTQPPIMARLREVAMHPAFAAVLPPLAAGQTLADAAIAFAAVYEESMDFDCLHCITALHAAQVLLAHARTDSAALAQQLWPALAAAHVVSRSEQPQPAAFDHSLAWPEIRRRACDSMDDHVIKMVFTCVAWQQITGQDVFRRCASKLVARGAS